MDSLEIDCFMSSLLSKTKCHWLGVFSSNTFPCLSIHDSYPQALICNSDKSGEPGSHWLAFYFTSYSCCEFFDSFAMPISTYSIIFHSALNITHANSKPIQSPFSNVCGYYCIYYLYNRALNCSSLNIYQSFSSSYYNNDKLVYKFISHIGFRPIDRAHIPK